MKLKNTWFSVIAGMVVCLAPDLAFAGTAATGLPWEDPMETIQGSITGPVAMAIVIVAMAAAGLTLIFGGEINDFMRRILMFVLAAGVVLFANNMIEILFPAAGALV